MIILSRLYNRLEAYYRCLALCSYLFFTGISIAHIVFAFYKKIDCHESRNKINMWIFIQSVVCLLYYHIYALLSHKWDDYRDEQSSKALKISFLVFHFLVMCSTFSFLGILFVYYSEMCNEWFELYLWISSGLLWMFSSINIITHLGLMCMATKENLNLLKTSRRQLSNY